MGFLSGIGGAFGSIHYVAPTGMINFNLANGSLLQLPSISGGNVIQVGPWVFDGVGGVLPGPVQPPHDIAIYHDDTAATRLDWSYFNNYQKSAERAGVEIKISLYGAGGNDILTTGKTKDWVYGGNDNDTINTGANADFLFGGLGRDILTGGAGNDNFVFNTTLGASSIDTITDFNNGNDTIRLENAIFRTIGATGVLNADAFLSNATGLPADAEDRIIYERDTGELYYDADGSGAGGQVLFAVLDAGLTLSAADFFVI